MRYEMKLGPYGQDMFDSDLQEFLNTCECVEKMNAMAGENELLNAKYSKIMAYSCKLQDDVLAILPSNAALEIENNEQAAEIELLKKLLKAEKEKRG